jgi:hypothetical protein
MKNAKMVAENELDRVNGGSTIVSYGNAGYISGDTPKWHPGDVLRVKYCEADGTTCRAKCTVMSVSSSKVAGPAGAEFAYTVIIVWLPASCSAAKTDIGKYYTLSESCLTQD